MSGDARQDVGQPSLRINAIHLGADDQAVHGVGLQDAGIGGQMRLRMLTDDV